MRGPVGLRRTDSNLQDATPPPELSLIIPTFNEAGNIEPLVDAITYALTETSFEIVFADDSMDGTADVIRRMGAMNERVKLRHREIRAGLASAVTEALPVALSETIVVMDGDLQHPPSVIPRMLKEARAGSADVVVASRYMPGGLEIGLSGVYRKIASRFGRWAAYAIVPRSRLTTDPLSGFFLFRKSILDGADLRPIGYKILLEVLVRGQVDAVKDVPFHFQLRVHEKSKANVVEGIKYIRQLFRLRG